MSANGNARPRLRRHCLHHYLPLFRTYANDFGPGHATHLAVSSYHLRGGNKRKIHCRLLPFMSVNTCAREMVDAILKEKILAFIPGWIVIMRIVKV
jgi:hypothetical protein